MPHERAMDIKEEISFFQAVKARLAKFERPAKEQSVEDMETTTKQVIDQALVSEQVVDVFDAAGIKKHTDKSSFVFYIGYFHIWDFLTQTFNSRS